MRYNVKIFLSVGLLIALIGTEVFAQSEIWRKTLVYTGHNFISSQAWADESGFILISFQCASDHREFRLTHRERGEISAFAGDVGFSEVFGFTSTETEFTLYFKGSFQGTKDHYFLTFFKNGNRTPVLTSWLDKAAHGEYLFSYSAYGKLYVVKDQKENLMFVEVTDYSKSKTMTFKATRELLNSFQYDKAYISTTYPGSKSVSRSGQIYCYPDSAILIKGSSNRRLAAGSFTALFKFDYTANEIVSRVVNCPYGADINSRLLNDRLYQLRFTTNLIGLGIYQYPSLKLLTELKYRSGVTISIKTSPLVLENGKSLEERWREDNGNEKIIGELIAGYPNLGVQHDSSSAILQISSLRTGTFHDTSTGLTSSGNYYIHFNACIDNEFNPCMSSNKIIVYDQTSESFRRQKQENKSDEVTMVENSRYTYNIHFVRKSKEYFIEEFRK